MGKVADIKTKQTEASVEEFLQTISDEQKRADSFELLRWMQKATGEVPRMWGASIIGFGNVRYKSPTSGREVDWFRIGFAPRKANLVLYLGLNLEKHTAALQQLGKHKTGVGCLYLTKLEGVDRKVLEAMITAAAKTK